MTWRIPSTWTPERDATATRMWLAGDSATIIGREQEWSLTQIDKLGRA